MLRAGGINRVRIPKSRGTGQRKIRSSVLDGAGVADSTISVVGIPASGYTGSLRGEVTPQTHSALILEKDRIRVSERGKELKEICFRIGLSLFKDPIFERTGADFLLGALPDECF